MSTDLNRHENIWRVSKTLSASWTLNQSFQKHTYPDMYISLGLNVTCFTRTDMLTNHTNMYQLLAKWHIRFNCENDIYFTVCKRFGHIPGCDKSEFYNPENIKNMEIFHEKKDGIWSRQFGRTTNVLRSDDVADSREKSICTFIL